MLKNGGNLGGERCRVLLVLLNEHLNSRVSRIREAGDGD